MKRILLALALVGTLGLAAASPALARGPHHHGHHHRGHHHHHGHHHRGHHHYGHHHHRPSYGFNFYSAPRAYYAPPAYYRAPVYSPYDYYGPSYGLGYSSPGFGFYLNR